MRPPRETNAPRRRILDPAVLACSVLAWLHMALQNAVLVNVEFAYFGRANLDVLCQRFLARWEP